MIMTLRAKLTLIALSVALTLPIIFTLDENRQSIALRRDVRSAPKLETLTASPVIWFRQLNDHLLDMHRYADEAIALYQWSYFQLGEAATDLVPRKGDFLFIGSNSLRPGVDPHHSLGWACPAGEDWPQIAKDLERSYENLKALTAPHGIRLSFIISPSKPRLYPEKLKDITSDDKYHNCLNISEKGGPLVEFARVHSIGPSGGILYPLDEYQPYLDDIAFYPVYNFHNKGKSVALQVELTLKALTGGEQVSPAQITLEQQISDLSHLLSFSYEVNYYVAIYDGLEQIEGAEMEAYRRAFRDFGIKIFHPRENRIWTSEKPSIDGYAIIIGNSFSGQLAPQLASGFTDTRQVQLNDMDQSDLVATLQWILTEGPDDLIISLHDSGQSRFVQIGDAAAQLLERGWKPGDNLSNSLRTAESEVLDFETLEAAQEYLSFGEGWYLGYNNKNVWGSGNTALKLSLAPNLPQERLSGLEFELYPYRDHSNVVTEVDILVNGQSVQTIQEPTGSRPIAIDLSGIDGAAEITLSVSGGGRPSDTSDSSDKRFLGINLSKFTLIFEPPED